MCSTQNYSDEIAATLDNENCLLCWNANLQMKYSITIGLEPLHGSHDDPTTMVSTFDLETNSFPVTVESGQGAEGMEEDTLFLSMTPNLGQIMLTLKMTYAYLDNNNNGACTENCC